MRTIRVVTRCATQDEFLAAFCRFVDGDHLFVVTRNPLPVGPRRRFLIQLKDEQVMLAGEAEVVACITDGTGVGGRNGMRMKMVEMDSHSRKVHTALLEAARCADALAPDAAVVGGQGGGQGKLGKARPGIGKNGASKAAAAVAAVAEGKPLRAPSSAYTLPANPFGELDQAALEQFIECTLYEEAGNVDSEDDGWSESPVAGTRGLVPTPGQSAPSPAPLAPGKRPRVKRGSEVGYSTEEETAWYGEEPRPTAPEPFAAAKPKLDQRMMMIIGGAVGGATILGLVIGLSVGSSGERPDEGANHEVTAAGATPTREGASDEVAHDPAKPATSAIDKPGAAGCTANITTKPPGVDVSWAGKALGKTPLSSAPVPCGKASVFLSHSRFRNVSVKSRAVAGTPVSLNYTMARMQSKLTLRSVPAGALFRVKGRSVGKGPTAMVPRYTRVAVVATLKGYKTWSGRVFVKGENQTVLAKLSRAKRSFKLPLKKRKRR